MHVWFGWTFVDDNEITLFAMDFSKLFKFMSVSYEVNEITDFQNNERAWVSRYNKQIHEFYILAVMSNKVSVYWMS